MARHRRPVNVNTSVGVTAPSPDRPVTYKMIQLRQPVSIANCPTMAELAAVDATMVRLLVGNESTHPNCAAYVNLLNSVTPNPIQAIVMVDLGQGENPVPDAAQFLARFKNAVDTIPATFFEVGNEFGPSFGGGANWDTYCTTRLEPAAAYAESKGRICVAGAALDTQTNAYGTALRNRYGGSIAAWHAKGIRGVAIHCYGHSGTNYDRAAAVANALQRVTDLRASTRLGPMTAGGLGRDLPIYPTECGWGAGGNVNSSMVATEGTAKQSTARLGSTTLDGNITLPNATIKVVDASVLPFAPGKCIIGSNVISYTGRNVVTNELTGCTGGSGNFLNGAAVRGAMSLPASVIPVADADPFIGPEPGTAKIWVTNFTGQNQVITYGIKQAGAVNELRSCTGGTGVIDNGQIISQEITPSNLTENEQGLLCRDMFETFWGPGGATYPANQGANRHLTSGLNLKCVTWFFWNDQSGANQWWHFCGIHRASWTSGGAGLNGKRQTGQPGPDGPDLTSGVWSTFANQPNERAYS